MPDFDITPGEVLDSSDLDAKLVTLKMYGAPHFTGLEMSLIEEHYSKSFSDLTMAEMQTATAFIYLRRAKGDGVTWDGAAQNVTLDLSQTVDPTGAVSLGTWPPSATTGE
jgi:hypothetical protein